MIYFINFLFVLSLNSQENKLSDGPFNQLIIRGATLINGNGSPPIGPVDIVVENNIIKCLNLSRKDELPCPLLICSEAICHNCCSFHPPEYLNLFSEEFHLFFHSKYLVCMTNFLFFF